MHQWFADRIPSSELELWPQHGHFTWADNVEAADMFATILGRDDGSLYREEAPEPRGQEC